MDRPEEIFHRCGYRQKDQVSITRRAAQLGAMGPPVEAGAGDDHRRVTIEGYSICEFELG